jgi:hypothetical protein
LAALAPGRVLRPLAGGLDVMSPQMSWPGEIPQVGFTKM